MAEFAHLHLHTEFSLLDGMGRIDDYVAKAKELGMHHLAVTDHGVMYAAKRAGKDAVLFRQVPPKGLDSSVIEDELVGV